MFRTLFSAIIIVGVSAGAALAGDDNARWAERYIEVMRQHTQAFDDVVSNRAFPLPVWPAHQLHLVPSLRVASSDLADQVKELHRLYAWGVPSDEEVGAKLRQIYYAGEDVRAILVQFALVDTRVLNNWNGYATAMKTVRRRFRDLPEAFALPAPEQTRFEKLYAGLD